MLLILCLDIKVKTLEMNLFLRLVRRSQRISFLILSSKFYNLVSYLIRTQRKIGNKK